MKDGSSECSVKTVCMIDKLSDNSDVTEAKSCNLFCNICMKAR